MTTHYDVFIFAGQSNMVGYNVGFDGLLYNDPKGGADRTSTILYHPVSKSFQGIAPGDTLQDASASYENGVCPIIGFHDQLNDLSYPNNIAIIKVAYAGSNLANEYKKGTYNHSWFADPDNSDTSASGDETNIFTPLGYSLFTTITKALSKLSSYQVKGFVWFQGESDWNSDKTLYQERLQIIIDRVREWVYEDSLPVVIIGTEYQLDPLLSQKIRNEQRTIASLDPNIEFIYNRENWGTNTGDRIHYNPYGQIQIGKEVANAMEIAMNSELVNMVCQPEEDLTGTITTVTLPQGTSDWYQTFTADRTCNLKRIQFSKPSGIDLSDVNVRINIRDGVGIDPISNKILHTGVWTDVMSDASETLVHYDIVGTVGLTIRSQYTIQLLDASGYDADSKFRYSGGEKYTSGSFYDSTGVTSGDLLMNIWVTRDPDYYIDRGDKQIIDLATDLTLGNNAINIEHMFGVNKLTISIAPDQFSDTGQFTTRKAQIITTNGIKNDLGEYGQGFIRISKTNITLDSSLIPDAVYETKLEFIPGVNKKSIIFNNNSVKYKEYVFNDDFYYFEIVHSLFGIGGGKYDDTHIRMMTLFNNLNAVFNILNGGDVDYERGAVSHPSVNFARTFGTTPGHEFVETYLDRPPTGSRPEIYPTARQNCLESSSLVAGGSTFAGNLIKPIKYSTITSYDNKLIVTTDKTSTKDLYHIFFDSNIFYLYDAVAPIDYPGLSSIEIIDGDTGRSITYSISILSGDDAIFAIGEDKNLYRYSQDDLMSPESINGLSEPEPEPIRKSSILIKKNTKIPDSSHSTDRSILLRATQVSNIPYKRYKTQNGANDSSSRLRRLRAGSTKASFSTFKML
jgi:hypothetical protein